ncbi:MAG: EAL domain-containing protein, partial [Gammaproteobacteria bacterium]|nr:EAL domain-containing protein [Gammaproteobacteria bacterium]
YYQSQVDSINKQIVGCEVLLRWHHPTLGAIPPDRFIPLLEQNGLIRMVGEWVMQQAIEQHLEWLRKGFPGVRIAVNFSAIQLQEETLAEWFIDVIRKSGISPPWFKLEITETTTIDNLDQAARSLQKIRSAGIQIAVDDFGTGYSTLNYLQRLPVDIIKIDQQFIKEIPSSKDDMTLVKAVIAMAHSMGFDVVAEGVETKVQADFLREHQCEELQGFYFSKPVPANEFEQLLITQGKVGAGSLEMF